MLELKHLKRKRLTRRRLLKAGLSLSALGLHASTLNQIRASQPKATGRANSCVFIFLFGGPSHIDLWDMKPNAPVEIRGEFQPIATNTTGIQICEHLPLLAQQIDKLCLLRSMTHRMPVHGPACSEVYSGRPYFGPPVTDQARKEDWPSIASMVHRFGPRNGVLPTSVVLPWYTQFVGQDRRIAGQTGGRMGEQFNPFLVEGNLTDPKFEIQGLQLPSDVSVKRLSNRRELRSRLQPFGLTQAQATLQTQIVESNFQSAADLVEKAESAGAFDLSRESTPVRDQYGLTRFGQSLLMARRLVEANVSLVTVNWDDDHKDDKVSPHWDTHVKNFPKLKDRLSPQFDRAMAGFLNDLDQRGLLETTLVVALGEFGRTPKIGVVTQNGMTQKTGRDHWPHAFTALVAGGGVRGGQVFGATTNNGGYVADQPVTPADLGATIMKHLGIDQSIEYHDEFLQLRQQLATGRPVDFT
jgi:hypothetical protein